MNQAIAKRTGGTAWSRKALLAACLMLGAALLAAYWMGAQPAHASTTLTVNSTGDFHDTISSDGFCGFGGSCSLRAAIEEANSNPGADTINFDIPGTGVKTIAVGATGLGALPPIKEQVNIDGYTQTGASPNTKSVGNDAALKIQLDGTNVPGANGLEIFTTDNSVIKGLVVNRFTRGIAISGDSVANRIEGNFIGTDPTGTTARGNNFHAVNIFDGPSQTVVGGSTPAARNVLSGSNESNITVSNSNGSQIQGNYVGTDKSGTKDLGNGSDGVFINNSQATIVGGTMSAMRNVVSGNDANGLDITGDSHGTLVVGNRIGTTASGTGALGNTAAGVIFNGATGISVGDGTSGGSNTVAFNGREGLVLIGGSFQDAISRNSIFSNGGLGINLSGGVEDAAGNTANDPGDVDEGPNGLQNKPVLSSAKTSSTKTTITGKLNASRDVSYVVEFYSNPSGNEGKKFIGQKVVTTDGSGNASFTFSPAASVAAGQTVTATAQLSRVVVGEAGGTSEFSAPRTVASS